MILMITIFYGGNLIMEDNKESRHESYGMVVVTRWDSNGTQLFGSPFKHSRGITLQIRNAVKTRSLSNDWISGKKEIVTVRMSESQFGRMVSSVGNGGGTPVTIKSVVGIRKEGCPSHDLKKTFKGEMEDTIKKVPHGLKNIIKEVYDICASKKSIGVAKTGDLLSKLNNVLQNLESNLPYIQDCFRESMEKVVDEAKTEVDARVINRLEGVQLSEPCTKDDRTIIKLTNP